MIKIEIPKTKGTNVYFFEQERKKKGKRKEMTTNNKPTIIHRHTPHQEKKDTMTFPTTWQKNKFGYRYVLHASLI